MGSTRVSRVLYEPNQKSTRIEIYKTISTQPGPNCDEPGWLAGSNPF